MCREYKRERHLIEYGHGHGHGHGIFILATHPEGTWTTNPSYGHVSMGTWCSQSRYIFFSNMNENERRVKERTQTLLTQHPNNSKFCICMFVEYVYIYTHTIYNAENSHSQFIGLTCSRRGGIILIRPSCHKTGKRVWSSKHAAPGGDPPVSCLVMLARCSDVPSARAPDCRKWIHHA